MNEIFFNKFERLRSGWRFIIFSVLFSLITAFVGIISISVVLIFLPDDKTGTFFMSPIGVSVLSFFSLTFTTLLGWFCGKYFEDLPLKALGWAFHQAWIKQTIWGLLIGAFSIIFASLLAMPSGGLSFTLNQTADFSMLLKSTAVSAVVLFIAAASEEVLFRGYILQTFVRAKLAWLGILLTSFPFAVAHLGNPNAEIISTINTALAGVWLGLAYLKTRSLWFAFGIHFAWNLVQGSFLGLPISGLTNLTKHSVLQFSDQGPAWLTGGSYGIEGGIACTISLLFSMLIVWFLPFIKADEEMLTLTSNEIPKEKSFLSPPAPPTFENV